MARPMKPLVRGGGYYSSNRWTPLVYPGGYTTANGGWQPEPEPVLKTVTGSFIHITDALALPAEALTVNVEPIQDLHGYDNPWPAGGGKNKCYADASNLFPRGDGLTIVTDAETLTAYAKVPKNTDCVFSCSGGQSRNSVYGFEQEPAVGVVGHALKRTQLTPASHLFNSGEYEYVGYYYGTIPTTNVMIELGSTATSYAPYSNICPISGWTGANVSRTGKNLIDHVVRGYISGDTVRIDNDSETGVFYAVSGETYTRSAAIAFDRFIVGRVVTKEVGHLTEVIEQVQQSGDTWTALWTGWTVWYGYSSNSQQIIDTFQIELGSTASAYAMPQRTTIPISWQSSAGTVYGGQLDVTQGKLTVDRAMVDLGTLTWMKITTSGGHWRFWAMLNTMRLDGQMISSQYRQISATEQYMGTQGIANQESGSNVLAMVSDERYADAVAFKAAMSGVQLVYELATPIEITLTPTQIEMLLGENNLWADAGDSTLTYYADGNASDEEALNILLGNRYYNNHEADEPTDREALDILLGNTR